MQDRAICNRPNACKNLSSSSKEVVISTGAVRFYARRSGEIPVLVFVVACFHVVLSQIGSFWTGYKRPEACNRPKTVILSRTAALLLSLTLTACNTGKSAPNYANFTKGLNNYFLEHTECLLPNTRFPLEITDKAQIKQMDSLVKASLLDKAVDPGVHTARYTPSTNGTRYAPRFCYGHREIVSIDTSSPLQVSNGFKTTSVTYHYKMEDVPVWAKTPEVQAAFPAMALATSGQATAKATLAQTAVGWQVPD